MELKKTPRILTESQPSNRPLDQLLSKPQILGLNHRTLLEVPRAYALLSLSYLIGGALILE